MAKGQQKKETSNKPKLSIHEKQAKKLAKKISKQSPSALPGTPGK